MSRNLAAAIEYADYGWQVLALHEKSKAPCVGNAWQKKSTDDTEQIAEWFEGYPERNLGVHLGPCSKIIDIECDGDEAEELYIKLWDGAPPVTPTFGSHRGRHRLFVYTTELPCTDKAVFKIGELEFRTGNGKGCQSVFPPSIHPDTGAEYKWLVPPSEVEPATLTPEVIAKISLLMAGETLDTKGGKGREHWEEVAKGVGEGNRNSTAASMAGRLIGMMADTFHHVNCELQFEMLQSWNERNEPPLDAAELRTTWDSILRKHNQGVASDDVAEQVERRAACHTNWKLIKVESQPVVWKLSSPLWEGFVPLSSEQLQTLPMLKKAVLEVAEFWCPEWFGQMWKGHKPKDGDYVEGLAAKLVASCEHEEAAPEAIRDCQIAMLVNDVIEKCEEVDEPNPRRACKVNGDVYLIFTELLNNMQHLAEPVKRGELIHLLESVESSSKVIRLDGRTCRFRVLDRRAQKGVQDLAMQGAHFAEVLEGADT